MITFPVCNRHLHPAVNECPSVIYLAVIKPDGSADYYDTASEIPCAEGMAIMQKEDDVA